MVPILAVVVAAWVATSCSDPTSSGAVAATRPPATIDLPPLVPSPTTVVAASSVPSVEVSVPEITLIAVDPPAQPIPAVGRESGAATAIVQQRLLDLGFWLQAVNGDYGVTTRQAVMAFQKYHGLPPTETVDEATAAALGAATHKAHGRANSGTLVEVDKTRQLVFLVENGVTLWAINASTGNGVPFRERDKTEWGKWVWGGANTPNGIFTVDREYTKGWRPGDLGEIYRPKYFNGGIALHGAYKIPAYPASHGCVRLSTPAMDFLWSSNLVPRGTTVWVHSEPA